MVKYFFKRILIMIPTLFAVILVVFALLNYLPGASMNPFRSYGGGDELDSFFEEHGIGDNFASRYIRYCYNVFVKHDFNPFGRKALNLNLILTGRFRQTLMLTGYGFLWACLFGIPLGLFAGIYKGKWQDSVISTSTLVLSSVPAFCLAIILIIFFALWLQILPVSGTLNPHSYVMPTIVLSASGTALLVRMTRSAVIDVLKQPYITALRAKGLSSRRVLCVHIMKNTLIQIVGAINNVLVQMLCGTLIVENLYSIPGLGSYLVTGVMSRSLHGVLGCVIFLAAILMLFNILADVLGLFINPRMRQSLSTGRKG